MKINDFSTATELKVNLEQVLSELKDTILNELDFKQAKILTYWLNDWNEKFLSEERNFNPQDLIKYTRGNIVLMHLGYNIGSEEGGLHYGLVLDKNNDKSSNVVTIIPLRSLKPGEKPEDIDPRFEYFLGCALLTPKIAYVEDKIDKISEKLRIISSDHKDYQRCCKQKRRLEKELANLMKGSVAIVSQIRTISKIRIYEPTKSYHSLSSFILDECHLNTIDNMINSLFIGNK